LIQKQTWVKLADSSLAKWACIFHLYGGFNRSHTSVSNFVKGSVRIVQPPIQVYKGFLIRVILKGKVSKVILTRQTYKKSYLNWFHLSYRLNAGIILKKKKIPTSQYILGPTSKALRFKKFLLLFNFIF
jgi:ribosomal protein L14